MPWEDLCRITLKKSIMASSPWLAHRFTHTPNKGSGKNCGDVRLVVRETKRFTVENAKVEGPNVLSFQMLTGKNERWHAVGCYFPPSDKEGEARRLAMAALDAAPEGTKPLLIGDLNSDLDFPWDRQEEILAADLEERGLRCVTRGFRPRRTRRMRGDEHGGSGEPFSPGSG